jgi:hypothetical protein
VCFDGSQLHRFEMRVVDNCAVWGSEVALKARRRWPVDDKRSITGKLPRHAQWQTTRSHVWLVVCNKRSYLRLALCASLS